MTQLVILVVAAAWLAVLIPPMLRSRVENRPNSSVTDFRRQLNKLQSTATPRPAMRAMGRPLTASPLTRPAAPGRPGQPQLRSGVGRQTPVHEFDHDAPGQLLTAPARRPAAQSGQRYRSHGDPTGGQRRPVDPWNDTGGQRRPDALPADVKRRRSNVLFLLVTLTACTLFLAATTSSQVMLYAFALAFLALCGYVYLLAQLRQREMSAYDGWLERY